MDIKDLEVRAIVSASSVNCSKLHPEKFYTLKNPGITLRNNSIGLDVDVYNDNNVLLGRIGAYNFLFGLNTNSKFSFMSKDNHPTGCTGPFIVKGDASFPDVIFLYLPGHGCEKFIYNNTEYWVDNMMPMYIKENSEITLIQNNCPAVFGFFGDGPHNPLYLIDNE